MAEKEYVSKKEFDRLQGVIDLLVDNMKELKDRMNNMQTPAPVASPAPAPVELKKGKDPMSWSGPVPQGMKENGPDIRLPSAKELESHIVRDDSFQNVNRNSRGF